MSGMNCSFVTLLCFFQCVLFIHMLRFKTKSKPKQSRTNIKKTNPLSFYRKWKKKYSTFLDSQILYLSKRKCTRLTKARQNIVLLRTLKCTRLAKARTCLDYRQKSKSAKKSAKVFNPKNDECTGIFAHAILNNNCVP